MKSFALLTHAPHGPPPPPFPPLHPGIDFKTVSSAGTGGFVVVAPTVGKTWTRSPWDARPLDPNDDDVGAAGSHLDSYYATMRNRRQAWGAGGENNDRDAGPPAPPIPSDLLHAVAKPTYAAIDAWLRFEGEGDEEELMRVKSVRWLACLEFFDPLLKARWPCDKHENRAWGGVERARRARKATPHTTRGEGELRSP